jgi:hypothetical protein
MPKRKRAADDPSDAFRAQKSRKESSISEYYAQSKKSLQRALKVGKGFVRQKLGKRLKLAKSKSLIPEIDRINREIEVLRTLDLEKVGVAYLSKCLLRIKAFNECNDLPEEVRGEGWRPEGTEEMVVAGRNVVSELCNMKQVKEVVDGTIQGMYAVLGIKKPAKNSKQATQHSNGSTENKIDKTLVVDREVDLQGTAELDEASWEGFSSSSEQANHSEDDESLGGDDIEQESLSDTEIAQYENLLGETSSEEASDDDIWARLRASITKDKTHPVAPSISLSSDHSNGSKVSPADLESGSDSELDSEEKEVSLTMQSTISKSKSKSREKRTAPVRSTASTFLPTLMGGYWSGTESSASDVEEIASQPPVRKNRLGQAARRAIWEKKYKSEANHIKSGHGSVTEQRDAGWDAKRGAQGGRGRGADRRGRGGRTGGVDQKSYSGGNTEPTKQRAASNSTNSRAGEKKRDDLGVLHPSWQAAKKAKSAEKTAKFEGKKMTFD